jgi:hypothetical protein
MGAVKKSKGGYSMVYGSKSSKSFRFVVLLFFLGFSFFRG